MANSCYCLKMWRSKRRTRHKWFIAVERQTNSFTVSAFPIPSLHFLFSLFPSVVLFSSPFFQWIGTNAICCQSGAACVPRKLLWSAVSPHSGGRDFLFKRDTCAVSPRRCRRRHCWDHTTEIWERFCILSYITVDHLCDLRRRQQGALALALADKWRSLYSQINDELISALMQMPTNPVLYDHSRVGVVAVSSMWIPSLVLL